MASGVTFTGAAVFLMNNDMIGWGVMVVGAVVKRMVA